MSFPVAHSPEPLANFEKDEELLLAGIGEEATLRLRRNVNAISKLIAHEQAFSAKSDAFARVVGRTVVNENNREHAI